MPDLHVCLPWDSNRFDLAVGEEGPCRLNGRRKTGMPGRKQRSPVLPSRGDQRRQFTDGRAWWFFEQHVLTGLQRGRRLCMAHLRRRTERYGIDIGRLSEKLVERREMRDAVDRCVSARDGDKFDALGVRDPGDVLVPG